MGSAWRSPWASLVAVFMLAAPAVGAQTAPAPSSPSPSPQASQPPPRDLLKNIPLAGRYPVTLSIGGQARWREEFYRGFNTLDLNDDNSQTRLLVSADVVAGRRARGYVRAFSEVRDDQSYGRTLPGGARPQDEDRHDVQTLFAEAGRGGSLLRYGRQEIQLGRERLIGVPDWSNTRRSSDGAHLMLTHGPIAFEAVDARPVIVRQSAPNRADSTQRFRTLSLGSASGAAPLARGLPAVWQAYWYEQTIRPVTGVRTYRLTTGGRVQWQWGAGSAAHLSRSLEAEAATQRGTVGTRTIAAWFYALEGQLQWKRVRGAPSLALGFDEASGENPATTDRLEVFTVLYPAAHQYGGYADVIGRPNVRELHAISTWDPFRTLNLRGAWFHFDRLSTADAVYTKQTAIFRAAGPPASTATHVADELDLTGTWRITNHLRLVAGYGLVIPGEFLHTATSRTERWGFGGVTTTF